MSITTGILQAGTNNHLTSSEEANAVATDFVTAGVVGTLANTNGVSPATGNFAVNAQGTPDMTVAVGSGVAYVTGTPTSQGSQTFRVKNSASANVTISANSSGSTKYDHLYIQLTASKLANPAVGADDVATLVTSRSSNASTDDGTPPTYGLKIAVITVANGAVSITNANIRDARTQAGTTSVGSTTATSGWSALGYTPSSVTYSGNRSYSMTFTSTDLTGTLSPGMRLRTTRTVAAPTQCTSLNGTNQYYSKTSPAGMTFTDDFVVGAWVKLSSYGSGGGLVSRYNGTNGWALWHNGSGQVELFATNGSSANVNKITSYQSLPLNKWVHVAAQLDMSTAGASSTTSYIMIDGVDVPCTHTSAGTNPTSLVQGGNLEIGSFNASTFFNGKVAQAFVSSAKITQANVRTLISQGLTSALISSNSIISAYSFDNSINDLNTTNTNNLTANNSAVATNADSPFGYQSSGSISSTLDYGIVMSASFSTNTTLVVQVPEGCTIPSSGGVNAVAYSTQDNPFSFPKQKEKWRVTSILASTQATTSNASFGAFISGGWQLVAPIGAWDLGWQAGLYNVTTTPVFWNMSPTALTGLSESASALVSRYAAAIQSAAASTSVQQVYIKSPQTFTTATTYTMYTCGATTSAGLDAANETCEIFAECAYL